MDPICCRRRWVGFVVFRTTTTESGPQQGRQPSLCRSISQYLMGRTEEPAPIPIQRLQRKILAVESNHRISRMVDAWSYDILVLCRKSNKTFGESEIFCTNTNNIRTGTQIWRVNTQFTYVRFVCMAISPSRTHAHRVTGH